MSTFALYIGAYTRRLPHVDGRGEGIYRCRLDAVTGALACDGVVARLDNPTFLAFDPTGRRLYAVSEADETAGQPGGALHAFAIDDAGLIPLNRQLIGGAAPCHLALDRAGRCAVIANYNGGSVSLLSIEEDGRVGPLAQLVQHTGAGPHPARQQSPHPHGVYFEPTGRYLLVADLGTDRVYVYRFATGLRKRLKHVGRSSRQPSQLGGAAPGIEIPRLTNANLLQAGSRATASAAPGIEIPRLTNANLLQAGSRATASVLQHTSTCQAPNSFGDALRLDEPLGCNLQRVSWATLHPGAGPRHLAFHPNGRWVYCINELDVTVSALAFDPDTGRLEERGWVSLLPDSHSEGRSPKNLVSAAEIALDPTGRFAYASLRGHDSIAVLAVAADGGLTLLGPEPTRGRTPRHFALSPDGRLLIAANQDSDTLVTFHIDPATGGLTPTGHAAHVPSPACILVQPAKNR